MKKPVAWISILALAAAVGSSFAADEQAALDSPATAKAQSAMAKAFPMGAIRPEDAENPQVVEAYRLVGKPLGEDARDLVFIPITPCTVWDTRYATSAPFMGAIGDGVTRQFYSHLDGAGGSFQEYGGNPFCPETAQDAIGGRPYAVMMTVYVNDAVGDGWLTFYRDGDADPSQATVSVYYSTGPTRTQTVISKSSRGYGTGAYDVAVTGRYGNAHAAASVTGYFLKPQSTALSCTTISASGVSHYPIPFPAGSDYSMTDSFACPAGYTRVAIKCGVYAVGWNVPLQSISAGPPFAACRWYNASGRSDLTKGTYFPESICCRISGR